MNLDFERNVGNHVLASDLHEKVVLPAFEMKI